MPEGPEVKLFIEKINKNFKNKKIKNIEVLSGRYSKKPILGIEKIKNLNFNSANCKGKFIWFDFGDYFAFNTLGMTGSWNKNKTKHSRICIEFYEDEKLYFNDIRNFGTFQIKTILELQKKINSIGPDMLSNPPKDFLKIIRKYNNKNICSVLMNQKIISGVGNYIKAESLWYSKVNPHAKVKDIPDKNIVILGKAIEFVINKSYKSQGASIKDYYTFDGESGEAVQGFAVYGRKKDPFGLSVIKEETPDKRTTHWVRERQKIGM